MSMGFAFLMIIAIAVPMFGLFYSLSQEHKLRQRQDAFEREMESLVQPNDLAHRKFRPF